VTKSNILTCNFREIWSAETTEGYLVEEAGWVGSDVYDAIGAGRVGKAAYPTNLNPPSPDSEGKEKKGEAGLNEGRG
jgi:hypothetical protein